MPLSMKIRSLLRNLISVKRADDDLDLEVQSHLAMLIDDNLHAGMPPKDAERAARIELGGVTQVKEQVREARLGNWLRSLITEWGYCFRQLRRSPGLTSAAILTLALGIGATTTIFSLVYGILLRPLPYPEPDRIMAIFELSSKDRPTRLADPNFDDFRDQNQSFQAIAKYSVGIATVSGTSQPVRAVVASVSPGFLSVFGTRPVLGRDFSPEDSRQGAEPTALVSYGYWSHVLGSPRDLSQSRLRIGRDAYSVIGVLPAAFQFPTDADLWIPADLEGANPSRTSHNYNAVGRLRAGVTVAQANQDISAIARRIHAASGGGGNYLLKDGRVLPLRDSITGKARPALLILLGAVAFLFLVACANVANLMLTQVSVRGRELAIRSALGASRARLTRQFLNEATLLALAGGGLGYVGALAGVKELVMLAPPGLPRLDSVAVNVPVLLFAFLLSLIVAGGLGAFIAARATSSGVRERLADGGRGQAGSQGSQKIGRIIVVSQIAITSVLMVGAGLFGRSLLKVLDVNPGFRVDRIVAMDVSLPPAESPESKAEQAIFFSRLIDGLRQIPGVRNVGATSGLPMTGGLPDGMFLRMNQNEAPASMDALAPLFRQKARAESADFCAATDGYFKVLGIPLLRGRLFDERDGANSPHAAVISESLARESWPHQDPIGHTIEFGNMDGDLRLLTIVGIVGDIRENGPDLPPNPTVYVNLFQRPRAAVSIAMLSDADTRSVSAAARSILKRMNPEIPPRIQTFSQVYSALLGSRKFNVILTGFFGITALLLATTGVFGVMAYSVSRRTQEFGVRVALGAVTGNLLRLVLGLGLRTVFIGVAIGIAGSLALTRVAESLLFGVTATDALTFCGVTFMLVASAMLACYIPARRATRVDPVVALRHE